MKTQKRVPNYQLEKLLSAKTPFTNYNGTISARITESGIYKVTHWNTEIVHYDLEKGEMVNWDFRYYSQTTSALQGRIIRALVSHAQLEMLLKHYKAINDTRNFRRVRGMARIV